MFLLVPAYPGSPGQKPLNGCVCVCVCVSLNVLKTKEVLEEVVEKDCQARKLMLWIVVDGGS